MHALPSAMAEAAQSSPEMAEEPTRRMTRAGAVARRPPGACPTDVDEGCNCNSRGSTTMGEGHRCTTTFAARGCDEERAGSSVSSLSRSPVSAANLSQFGIGEIHVIMGSDSDSGSSSADGERVISHSPSSSSSDFAIGMAEGIDRPGNPRPSLSQTSSHDKLLHEASGSSASSSLSLVQRLLGRRRRRFPSSVYLPGPLPAPIGNNTGNDGRHVTISEREVGGALQTDVESLEHQLRNVDDALTGLEARTKLGRRGLLGALASCGGDAKDSSLVAAVEELGNLRRERIGLVRERDGVAGGLAGRLDKLDEICMRSPLPFSSVQPPDRLPLAVSAAKLEGNWFTLTKPTYLDCLGCNADGNPMYTLGRMSFEMFRPGKLVVSIEAVFNPITEVVQENGEGEVLAVPKALREEVALLLDGNRNGEARGGRRPALRTYHIVTAFVIEPYSPSFGPDSPNTIVKKPIRGVMTTYGYALPDPAHPDRLSVWFTGGKVECGEPRNSPEFQAWKRLFRREEGAQSPNPAFRQKRRRPPRRTFREGVMVAAAKMLMGARGYDDGMDEETGEMSYSFSRPLGGHGKAYVDIVHLDEQTRVMRGHAGTLYVFTRLSK